MLLGMTEVGLYEEREAAEQVLSIEPKKGQLLSRET